jgi:hypothetical protein
VVFTITRAQPGSGFVTEHPQDLMPFARDVTMVQDLPRQVHVEYHANAKLVQRGDGGGLMVCQKMPEEATQISEASSMVYQERA